MATAVLRVKRPRSRCRCQSGGHYKRIAGLAEGKTVHFLDINTLLNKTP